MVAISTTEAKKRPIAEKKLKISALFFGAASMRLLAVPRWNLFGKDVL